jgi:CO dehydrogenase/acetyl-CoA synthase epsilon subunit
LMTCSTTSFGTKIWKTWKKSKKKRWNARKIMKDKKSTLVKGTLTSKTKLITRSRTSLRVTSIRKNKTLTSQTTSRMIKKWQMHKAKVASVMRAKLNKKMMITMSKCL